MTCPYGTRAQKVRPGNLVRLFEEVNILKGIRGNLKGLFIVRIVRRA
jgi:hypothetical protein